MSLGTYDFGKADGYSQGYRDGRRDLARELFAPDTDHAPWCCVTFVEGMSGFASGIIHNEWGHDGPCDRDWGRDNPGLEQADVDRPGLTDSNEAARMASHSPEEGLTCQLKT